MPYQCFFCGLAGGFGFHLAGYFSFHNPLSSGFFFLTPSWTQGSLNTLPYNFSQIDPILVALHIFSHIPDGLICWPSNIRILLIPANGSSLTLTDDLFIDDMLKLSFRKLYIKLSIETLYRQRNWYLSHLLTLTKIIKRLIVTNNSIVNNLFIGMLGNNSDIHFQIFDQKIDPQLTSVLTHL